MSLKVSTRKNHLRKKEASAFFVCGLSGDAVDSDTFIDAMSKGRTTLTKPDIIGVMELFKEEIGRLLSDGRYVKTPIGSFYLSASGILENETDSFQPQNADNNHEIRIHFRPKRSFERNVTSSVKVLRAESTDRSSAKILSAVTVRDGAESKARVGDTIRIEGLRLRFDPAESAQGLFFINDEGHEARARVYALVTPSRLIAEVPQGLVAGGYTLAVRTLPSGRVIREGCAVAPFTVEAAPTP